MTSSLADRYIYVDVDPLKLKRYRLTMSEVQRKIQGFIGLAPVGSFYRNDHTVMVEIADPMKGLDSLKNISLRTSIGGEKIVLGQIAKVRFQAAETASLRRLSGQPFVEIMVNKGTDSDAINLGEEITDLVAELNQNTPDGIQLEIGNLYSDLIRQQMDVLTSNGIVGFFLVIIVLWIFLGLKPALMTSLGLPIGLPR